MELRPFRALRGAPRFKERRPGLWIERQVLEQEGQVIVLPLLVGLVRLSQACGIELPGDPACADAVARRVGALVVEKADAEACLLASRAPLAGALSTTRRPDFTIMKATGLRHDFIRIDDYAQHVDLQGLVKNAEARLVAGHELWEAARQFAVSPAAAKLPGARFKLCAIVEERLLAETTGSPQPASGILGFSFADPVY